MHIHIHFIYIYIYVIYIYTHLHIHIGTYSYLNVEYIRAYCVCLYTHMYTHMYMHMQIHIRISPLMVVLLFMVAFYVYAHVHVYVYLHIYIGMCVYIPMCIYPSIYLYVPVSMLGSISFRLQCEPQSPQVLKLCCRPQQGSKVCSLPLQTRKAPGLFASTPLWLDLLLCCMQIKTVDACADIRQRRVAKRSKTVQVLFCDKCTCSWLVGSDATGKS